jgi:hemolysin activation/secretion protein
MLGPVAPRAMTGLPVGLSAAVLLLASAVPASGWAVAAEDQGLLAQGGSEAVDRPSAQPLGPPGFLPRKPAEGFTLPPLRPEPPEADRAGGASLQVKSYRFEGNTVFSSEELQRIAEPYVGRVVGASDLEDLRHRLTRFYVEHGYINSGAVIPDGALTDGELRIRIVEGQLQEIRLKGMERLREQYLRGRLGRGAAPLNVNVLQENFQLLLADPLFSKMDARLLPGSEPGRAILDVDVTRARPYQLSVFANNYRPPSIGENALGASGWARNLTGLGDVLDASIQNSAQVKGGARYGLGWGIPLNSFGTQLQLRLDHGRSSVLEAPLNYADINSTLDSREIGLAQTVIEDLRHRFALGFVYAQRENRTTLLGEPFSFIPGEPSGHSRINVWRFWQDYVQRMEQRVFALRSTFSFGRTNILEDPGLPGAQPAPDFFAWLGQAQYAHRFAKTGSQLLLRAEIQWTPYRLLPLEQMAVGGVNTVRGYRENYMVRDNGNHVTVEYQHPLLGGADGHYSLTFAPFVDYGSAKNIGGERDRIYSAGVGLLWRWQRVSASLYLAKHFVVPPTPPETTLQDRGIHFEIRYDAF